MKRADGSGFPATELLTLTLFNTLPEPLSAQDLSAKRTHSTELSKTLSKTAFNLLTAAKNNTQVQIPRSPRHLASGPQYVSSTALVASFEKFRSSLVLFLCCICLFKHTTLLHMAAISIDTTLSLLPRKLDSASDDNQ